MALRIGIAGFWHETNVFATERIGHTALAQFRITRGGSILERFRGTRTTVGGAIDEASKTAVELVPLVHAAAAPWGTIDALTYRTISEEIVDAVRAAGSLDAIFIDLHGAGVAEGAEDVEGDLSHRIRAAASPGIRLATAFDLHANVASATVSALDAVFVYTTYPHIDTFDRGAEAMRTLVRTCRGEIHPVISVLPLPMQLPPLAGWTGSDPIVAMNRVCVEAESTPGILDCTLVHGFHYSTSDRARTSIVVVSDGEPAAVPNVLRRVAEYVWTHRGDLDFAPPLAAEGITRARSILAARGGPVVINEANDNTGSGAPGDGTHLLRALLAVPDLRATLGPLTDPAAAQRAHAAGIGSTIRLALGGNVDRTGLSGQPIDTEALIVGLSQGRFRRRNMAGGLQVDMGLMAALRVGSVDVVVSSKPDQAYEPVYFETVGIDPRTYDIVGVKSINHFRAGFASFMTAAIPIDGPGLSCADLRMLTANPPHCWPWDPETSFATAARGTVDS